MTEKHEIEVADQSSDNEVSLFSGLPSEVLEKLSPAKNRMILMYLTGQHTLKNIAQIIGVSDVTIRAWLNQEEVQLVIKELQAREFALIESSLKVMKHKALKAMNDLLDSPIDGVKFQASKDILDRTGHKATQQIKIDKTVTSIEQQLKDLNTFTIDDAEVIDISDVVEMIKSGQ